MEYALPCFRRYLCNECILSLDRDYSSLFKRQQILSFGKNLCSLGTFLRNREDRKAFEVLVLFMEIWEEIEQVSFISWGMIEMTVS